MGAESQQMVEITGVIVQEKLLVGSKSEGLYPVLVLEDGEKMLVHVDGDNPFTEPTLHAFIDKKVIVTGIFEKGRLVTNPANIIEIHPLSGDTNA